VLPKALWRCSDALDFPRLRHNVESLRRTHRYTGVQAVTGCDIGRAAEWLLDNFYLVDHGGKKCVRACHAATSHPLTALSKTQLSNGGSMWRRDCIGRAISAWQDFSAFVSQNDFLAAVHLAGVCAFVLRDWVGFTRTRHGQSVAADASGHQRSAYGAWTTGWQRLIVAVTAHAVVGLQAPAV
jgi:hypothetical protein